MWQALEPTIWPESMKTTKTTKNHENPYDPATKSPPLTKCSSRAQKYTYSSTKTQPIPLQKACFSIVNSRKYVESVSACPAALSDRAPVISFHSILTSMDIYRGRNAIWNKVELWGKAFEKEVICMPCHMRIRGIYRLRGLKTVCKPKLFKGSKALKKLKTSMMPQAQKNIVRLPKQSY